MQGATFSLSSVTWTIVAVLTACAIVGPTSGGPNRAGRPQLRAQALSIAQLTPIQRANLPAATRVRFKSGRVAILGALRQDHRKRMARFARFARLRSSAVSPRSAHGRFIAMKPVTQGPVDFRAFCNAAHGSGCLWFPPAPGPDEFGAVGLYTTAGPLGIWTDAWVDIDSLITDAKVCASEGGYESSEGCVFAYPAVFKSSFNPGLPAPGQTIGAGVTWNQTCSAQITPTVDQRGAIQLAAPAPGPDLWNDGPAGQSCVVRVYLPPKGSKASGHAMVRRRR